MREFQIGARVKYCSENWFGTVTSIQTHSIQVFWDDLQDDSREMSANLSFALNGLDYVFGWLNANSTNRKPRRGRS
jgi:hypothetical protein